MRRWFAIITTAILLLGLVACGGTDPGQGSSLSASGVPAETPPGGQEETHPAETLTPPSAETLPVPPEEVPTPEAMTQPAAEIDWDAIECQPAEFTLWNWDRDSEEMVWFGPRGEKVTVPAQPVRDVFTGEVRYYTVSCTSASLQLGWKPGDTFYQLLFDAEGNLLEKTLFGGVDGAVGPLLIRTGFMPESAGADCGLWDLQNGRYTAENISGLYRIDADMAAATDKNGNLRGILDRETLEVTELETDRIFVLQWVQDGLIFVTSEDHGPMVLAVLDRDLRMLYESGEEGWAEYRGVFDCGEDGLFFCVNDRDGGRILRVKDGAAETVYENDYGSSSMLMLTGCSGGRMVISDRGFYLYDLNGTPLTEAWDSMGFLQEDGELLAAARGETVCLLDADGTVLRQKDVPGLIGTEIRPGAISYVAAVQEDGAVSERDCDDRYVSGLMNADFDVIITPEPGADISARSFGEDGGYLWVVSRMIRGAWSYDLYDSSLRPIIRQVSMIGTIRENGIAVQKGFSRGVIGFDGNWIAEYSIYEDSWRD